MARKKKKLAVDRPASVQCPFTILIDNQEKQPYKFADIASNSDNGNLPFDVKTEVRWLSRLGDYSLILPDSVKSGGRDPKIMIERKSKHDFFGSMAKRENWEERLGRMCEEVDYPAVIVEAEWSDIFDNPDPRSDMAPKAMHRTYQSWTIEFSHVRWFFYPCREDAEVATFWLLYRFYEKVKKFQTDSDRRLANYNAYWEGQKAYRNRVAVTDCPYPRKQSIGDLRDFWCRGWIDAQDSTSSRTKGALKCSDPPEFPKLIFNSDFRREEV